MAILPKLNVKAGCLTTYTAVHNSGGRTKEDIKYIVLHSTEGPTAQGAASWFTNPNSGGSANIVVDDKVCYLTLHDLTTPWGAPPLNKNGFHIEQAGYTAWNKAQWMLHLNTIRRAAYKAALRCKWYGIPPVFLSVADLKAGKKSGITTHNNISLAFGQSNHTDPGKGYPISTFMWFLNRYLKSL